MPETIPTSGGNLRVPKTAGGLVHALRENECETTSPYLSSELAESLVEAFVENQNAKLREELAATNRKLDLALGATNLAQLTPVR